jgi:hypothetical protein
MFERFVVNSLRFHYVSAVPTSVGGALIMGFDKDPEDQLQAGESGIRHLMGLSSVTQFAAWEHASLDVRKENDQNFYFTSTGVNAEDDSRLVFTGLLSIIVMTPGSLSNGSQIGDLWVEADVTFYDPTWEPMDRVAQATYLDSGPDNVILSNDRDAAWDDLTPGNIASIVSNSNQAYFERGAAPDGHNHGSFRLSPGQWTISDSISGLLLIGNADGPNYPTDHFLTAVPYGLDDRPVQNSSPIELGPSVNNRFNFDEAGYTFSWQAVYDFVLARAVTVLANGILSSLPVLYWRIFQSFNLNNSEPVVNPPNLATNAARSVEALWNGYLNAVTTASPLMAAGVAYRTATCTSGLVAGKPRKPPVPKPVKSALDKPVVSPGKAETDESKNPSGSKTPLVRRSGQ